jgi:hypothetical protein
VRSRAWFAAIALATAILAFVWHRSSGRSPSLHDAATADLTALAAAAATTPPGTAPALGSAVRPPDHVTRLATPADRQAVADRIAAAHAQRARQVPPQQPSLPSGEPDTSHDLEHASPRLKVALQQAIGFLAECYKTAPITNRRPAVQMTLTGDPDVGTLISADQLIDPEGKPIDPELEGCLRITLSSLELPPLGNTGDLHLQYSFRLDGE